MTSDPGLFCFTVQRYEECDNVFTTVHSCTSGATSSKRGTGKDFQLLLTS